MCLPEAFFFVTAQYEEDQVGLVIAALIGTKGGKGWPVDLLGEHGQSEGRFFLVLLIDFILLHSYGFQKGRCFPTRPLLV